MMDMLETVREVITGSPRKLLDLNRDIQSPVAEQLGRGWEEAGGYEAFAGAVQALVEEGRLRPVQRSGLNGRCPALALRYHRVIPRPTPGTELTAEILNSYHSRMNLTHFLDHPASYLRQREVLRAIDRFLLAAGENPPQVRDTVNERSYQLTGNEKFLASRAGKQLLRLIGISLDDLCCVPAPEPFFYWATGLALPGETACLVVENKDTFFSCKQLLVSQRLTVSPPLALLIYGEGKKILSSWPFIYECLPAVTRRRLYYFGDLDPEGVAICADLITATHPDEGVEVLPSVNLYRLLLATGNSRPLDKDQSRVSGRRLQPFFRLCPDALVTAIQDLWSSGRMIPQEAISTSMLAAMGGVSL